MEYTKKRRLTLSVRDWPAEEQPRNKVLNRGADVLSDAELLSVFIRSGCQGQTAVDVARTLLQTFGGLRGLLNADQDEVCAIAGIGPAKFAELKTVMEISRRYLRERLQRGDVLDDPDAVRFYLTSKLRDRKAEVFAVVFVDNRHRVIAYEEMFQGTIDGASVYPREVVRAALRHNAAAVILSHNHPSGVGEPSQSDERITRRLRDALALIDVRVLDHFVVGDQLVSMLERGLL
ncbi:MAG: RadC family protein [Thiolinea sp.]